MSDGSKLIGRRIRETRLKREWTQDQLARALEVTWVTVSRWERAVNPPPLDRLHDIAEVLQTTVAELVTEDGHKEVEPVA